MAQVNLSVEYCGLRLANPVIVAPAAITETAEHIRRCEEAGAAAVVMKSYFEFEPARRHATPRFRIIRSRGPLASSVLYSFEQASVFDLAGYCREIERAKRVAGLPVFASLNCVSEEHWREAAAAVEAAGADGIELNCSCPHGTHMMSVDDIVDAMAGALAAVREATSLPVVPKLTPQLSRPDAVAVQMQERGARAVVMFNRFTGLDIDISTQRPILHGGYAGHGGPWAIHYVLRWLTATYPRLTIPIAASGGVFEAEDAVKVILAGASVVQVCSAVVVEGYQAIARIVRGLAEYLKSHGYRSVDEIRGRTCKHILGVDEVDRRNRFYAHVDTVKCGNCGACFRVCIYGAVRRLEDSHAIDPQVCDGCGLCAEVCPTQAISMIQRPVPLERS